MSDITRWDMEPGWDGFMVADSIGKYVLFTDHEAAVSALTESRDHWHREWSLLNAAELKAEERVKELEKDLEHWRLSRDGVMSTVERIEETRLKLQKENSKLTAERDRLREALDLIHMYLTDHPELIDRNAMIARITEIAKATLAEK